MASRWRHWDAGCHDSLQTVLQFQSLQQSSETDGSASGLDSSDEELQAVPTPGLGRGITRPPAASIRLPPNLAYPEPRKTVENHETKQKLCRVGVGRGRGRVRSEVLGKTPGKATDNGYVFSGSAGDFRAYTKQSLLKQLPSHNADKNDNGKERESETQTQSQSATVGLQPTRRLWIPDPKKRWRREKIVEPDDVEQWPHLPSNGSSRSKNSGRKRKGKADDLSPPGASPDERSSPKTDDQKTLEKQHSRKNELQDKGKEKEVVKTAPDLSPAELGAVLGAADWIRLGNLPPGVTSQEVCGILEPFGAIVECHVHRHADHSSALVRLADSDVCEWCVSCLNETESPFPGWQGPLFCSHVRSGD
ncbi:PREDICTED: uncharacterized protein LOC109461751 isoform X3 [Branchiostoma belcheri]|uniref:Uncharacterized protein LOC109461751 isoform X3 n=1 Tax=Branchiostoma belcheri TaxID=7741 RepID=A0A6P4XBC4_BRABE|nr:PREDICTED: uncharacterized protein LOC109461751 isoform X3 [Branchiostoma belcheri]